MAFAPKIESDAFDPERLGYIPKDPGTSTTKPQVAVPLGQPPRNPADNLFQNRNELGFFPPKGRSRSKRKKKGASRKKSKKAGRRTKRKL
jgi:hypothetical protein